jgi:hypothetical protein
MTEYQDHPVSSLFSLLGEADLQSLAKDIAANGLQVAITLTQGMILDGRNRYRACKIANVEPRFDQYQGSSPVAFVMSMNFERRHLTKSQRATVAEDAQKWFRKEAKARMKAGGEMAGRSRPAEQGPMRLSDPIPGAGESREQAAKLAGVSPAYVSLAAAVKKADPELYKQVKAGKVELQEAKRTLASRGNLKSKKKKKRLAVWSPPPPLPVKPKGLAKSLLDILEDRLAGLGNEEDRWAAFGEALDEIDQKQEDQLAALDKGIEQFEREVLEHDGAKLHLLRCIMRIHTWKKILNEHTQDLLNCNTDQPEALLRACESLSAFLRETVAARQKDS